VVREDLARRTYGEAHHGNARGERLDHGPRQSLVPRRDYHDVEPAIDPAGIVDVAEKEYPSSDHVASCFPAAK
jgi:hypothetical protein